MASWDLVIQVRQRWPPHILRVTTPRANSSATPATTSDQAARRVIGDDRTNRKHNSHGSDHAQRDPINLIVKCETDKLDSVGERIQPANGIDDRAGLLHEPQRI